MLHKNYLKENPDRTVSGQLRMKAIKIRDSQLKKNKLSWYAHIHDGIDQLLKREHSKWACDDCIQSGNAIKADFEKQLFCDNPPYWAYCIQ